MSTILITGGTGLVGKNLISKLIKQGHLIRVLSRTDRQNEGNVEFYKWDVSKGELDEKAVLGIDKIIHLAGAGVADNAWSPSYKKEIIKSRVDSIRLIYDKCKLQNSFPNSIISASGTAYYGFDNSSVQFDENAALGAGFLSKVSQLWESASMDFNAEGVRRVLLRIGVVLSDNGGALDQIKKPFQFGIGSAIGTGKQPFPWIHIDDLTNAIIYAMDHQAMSGTFNAVAPETITNGEFSRSLAQEMGKPYWAPNVPSFLLRLILGKEKANEMLLNGAYVSSGKLVKSGFVFMYPNMKQALKDLL